MQLIEAGVPVWDLLGKKIGKSASELQTLSASGQLGRDSIRQLIAAMEDDAKGAAASNVSTGKVLCQICRISGSSFWLRFPKMARWMRPKSRSRS
ncbi:tape measure protein [Paludibacterium denitrificans]|uniref:tape measure protein n=1 Tax=Paludibacterium denitrificans TaxID=2675226 RepID=UPI002477D88E|nr:tape measure protein [Paludibacterium denitrificans]